MIPDAESNLQRRADRLVSQEVHACMSSLVATLAAGYGTALPRKSAAGIALDDLAEQAQELAAPVLDYESAARESGWVVGPAGMLVLPHGDHDDDDLPPREEPNADGSPNWQGAVEQLGNDPHECEVYEHWAISTWLAEKLAAKGERVDTDFAGLNVWARTTTGQAIAMDSVIRSIVQETGFASGA